MSRSSTRKTATAATPASPRASAPLRRGNGAASSASAAHLTSQRIAADLAAFKKAGGRIEVLGNTPLRPYTTSRSTTRKATKVAPKAAKAGAKG